jgi:tetratricopeptide (TPR) repeat protein
MKIAVLSIALAATSAVAMGQSPTPRPTPVRASVEARERAFAAMLEGQRYVWLAGRTRSQAAMSTNTSLAKAAFLRAAEADPNLAEAYTALAELAVELPPGDAAAGADYANRAIRIDRNNLGAHRVLAVIHTFRSGLNTNQFNAEAARLAVAQWSEVARIDPRNAEAWAFLSELKNPKERITALRRWLAGAQPTDANFYRRTMGGGADLRPEAAAVKLGVALTNSGEYREAIEVLSLVVADSPENTQAIDFLAKAVEASNGASVAPAAQSLQQAVFADPTNVRLIRLLAQVQQKSGRLDDAVAGLNRSTERLLAVDRNLAAEVQVVLGDIYANAKRVPEAVAAYERALKTRSIEIVPVAAADRDFAIMVFGKIIDVYRAANRTSEANAVRDRARRLLETSDLFATR